MTSLVVMSRKLICMIPIGLLFLDYDGVKWLISCLLLPFQVDHQLGKYLRQFPHLRLLSIEHSNGEYQCRKT